MKEREAIHFQFVEQHQNKRRSSRRISISKRAPKKKRRSNDRMRASIESKTRRPISDRRSPDPAPFFSPFLFLNSNRSISIRGSICIKIETKKIKQTQKKNQPNPNETTQKPKSISNEKKKKNKPPRPPPPPIGPRQNRRHQKIKNKKKGRKTTKRRSKRKRKIKRA